jgi:acyl-CoA synthetase (AMP-forming)/AMP-acid ligase II
MLDNFTTEREFVNVSARLTAIAAMMPDATAIIDADDNQITFGELERDVERIARGLVAAGVQPGQRLALLVPPSIEFVTLVFALLRSGAVQILIDPGMGKKNLIGCLSEAEPEGFVAVTKAQIVRAIFRKRFLKATFLVTVGKKLGWGGYTLNEIRKLGDENISRERVAGVERSEPPVENSLGARLGARPQPPHLSHLPSTLNTDPAAIIFTTGSTGPPKGVLYHHEIFETQVAEIQNRYNIVAGEVDVPCFPLFGLFNAAMGVTTVFPKMDFSRPASCDPENVIDRAIIAHNATQSFASPAVWKKVGLYCEKNHRKFTKLKRVLAAGAPLHAPVLRRMVDCLPEDAEMHTPYGATEALPVASITAREVLNETWQKTEQGAGICVGNKFSLIEWKVIRITDGPIATLNQITEVPAGEIGELIVSGPAITREYVTRRDVNALAKIADPQRLDNSGRPKIWHRMGDAGYLDEQDRFWFCGRVAHRVIANSQETLFTIPCEAIFNLHPSVERTALVGIGPAGNQTSVLVVEPRSVTRGIFGYKLPNAKHLESLRLELFELGSKSPLTRSIKTILFHPNFPVDIRHNAKIFREKLAIWAESQLQ